MRMMAIQSVNNFRELTAAFSVRRLNPFGLEIGAGEIRDLSRLNPGVVAQLLKTESLVLLRGFDKLAGEQFLNYCRSYPSAKLLEWSFGPVMEMKEDPAAKNYLFSRERVPFHWDGAFHQVPSFLVFNCVEAPREGGGGETLFTDTGLMWRSATRRERSRWNEIRLTYQTEKLAHYGGKVTVPMVQRHPQRKETVLRYAEPVTSRLNPVTLQVEGVVGSQARFEAMMEQRIYDPNFCYSHRWEPGDVLIADNHALLHGRNAFTEDCPRHLRRIQIM